MENLDIEKLNTNKGLVSLLMMEPLNFQRAIRYIRYERKLKKLQVELIRMQKWVIQENKRVIVLLRAVMLQEKVELFVELWNELIRDISKWLHFQNQVMRSDLSGISERYVKKFPKQGELVFFDRSWYNRAVVEPVNSFCSPLEYEQFMDQVDDFEKMISQSGIPDRQKFTCLFLRNKLSVLRIYKEIH